MQSQQWVREIPRYPVPVAITIMEVEKNTNFEKEPTHFPSFSPSKIVRRVADTSFGKWWSLDSSMAQARRKIRRGNVMKVEVFLWLQLWLTRWDVVESSCLKCNMSLNILEHTSCQELTCNPFLNWTGLGKSIIATNSLAIDSWDHFESPTAHLGKTRLLWALRNSWRHRCT